MFSSASHALIDGYYSQAVDIDYALPGEDESIRIKLENVIRKFLSFVAIDEEGSSMGFTLDYFGNDDNLTSSD